MGVIFPFAVLLLVLEALAVIAGILGSRRERERPSRSYLYWRRWLVVTTLLSILPALLAIAELIGDWQAGHFSAPPFVFLLMTLVIPAGLGLFVMRKRRGG